MYNYIYPSASLKKMSTHSQFCFFSTFLLPVPQLQIILKQILDIMSFQP